VKQLKERLTQTLPDDLLILRQTIIDLTELRQSLLTFITQKHHSLFNNINNKNENENESEGILSLQTPLPNTIHNNNDLSVLY
jgi:CO dehydrogenase/acetyl-CoA synthase beta subunit